MKQKAKWLAFALAVVILAAGLAAFFFETQHNATTNNVIRVACVGDSITEGTEYPGDLRTMLGANYSVGNFGVGGSTVSLESDKPYMNQTAFQNAVEFMPNIVIIMLGTNDAYPTRQQFLSYFTSDYQKLISSFQTIPTKPKIFIVIPPPIFNNTLGPDSTIFVEDVIPLIRQVANQTGLPTIDVYSPLVNHPEDFWDGVHPNSAGARIVATQIYDAVTSTV